MSTKFRYYMREVGSLLRLLFPAAVYDVIPGSAGYQSVKINE